MSAVTIKYTTPTGTLATVTYDDTDPAYRNWPTAADIVAHAATVAAQRVEDAAELATFLAHADDDPAWRNSCTAAEYLAGAKK